MMDELVSAVLVLSVASSAVTEPLPAVLRVTLNEPVPATSAAFAGRPAWASLDVIAIVSITESSKMPPGTGRSSRATA